MSWLLRGAQSAVFYYVSCSPYFKWRSKRRRKKEDRADRRARQVYEAHNPSEMLYRQPSAQGTNQYWAEEIAAGPSLKKQKKTKFTAPQAVLLNRPALRERGNTLGTSSTTSTQEGFRSSVAAGIEGTPTAGVDGAKLSRSSSRREFEDQKLHKGYQQEDEELWGIEFSEDSSHAEASRTRSNSSLHGSVSVPHYPTRASADPFNYATPRAPPVNDLHPPVASNPRLTKSLRSSRWMMQPNPAPSHMNGNVNSKRNASVAESIISRTGHSTPSHQSSLILRKDEALALRRKMSARVLENALNELRAAHGGTGPHDSMELDSAQLAELERFCSLSSRTSSALRHHVEEYNESPETQGEEYDDGDDLVVRSASGVTLRHSLHNPHQPSRRRKSRRKMMSGDSTATSDTVVHRVPAREMDSTGTDADVESADEDDVGSDERFDIASDDEIYGGTSAVDTQYMRANGSTDSGIDLRNGTSARNLPSLSLTVPNVEALTRTQSSPVGRPGVSRTQTTPINPTRKPTDLHITMPPYADFETPSARPRSANDPEPTPAHMSPQDFALSSADDSLTPPSVHARGRTSTRHAKTMTPDTAAYIFAYPMPLPEALHDPAAARRARMAAEWRALGPAALNRHDTAYGGAASRLGLTPLEGRLLSPQEEELLSSEGEAEAEPGLQQQTTDLHLESVEMEELGAINAVRSLAPPIGTAENRRWSVGF